MPFSERQRVQRLIARVQMQIAFAFSVNGREDTHNRLFDLSRRLFRWSDNSKEEGLYLLLFELGVLVGIAADRAGRITDLAELLRDPEYMRVKRSCYSYINSTSEV